MTMTRHWGGACRKGGYHAPPCDPPTADDTIDSLRNALAAAERTVREQREALERAMTLLADADDTYSESLLDSLFDSDDGFALDFYNTEVAALAPDTEGEGT